jgi:prepilin-type N-terminal cleavage/methylation domain-containing protein
MQRRKGYTLLEIIVVIMMASVLITIALKSMNAVQGRTSVQQARSALAAMHARARAQAVEFGQRVVLNMDALGDSIWVSRNDTLLEVSRLGQDLGVDLNGSGIESVCMNARGFADEGCNTFTSVLWVTFVQGADSASVRILPLGQILY